ncbi:hypothetical protein SLS62_005127 [Diatrype stigma]|uniref:BZIP domain-containing protein n=1 Tax=Diatrype stigma TaxID=117547 RepID=A0AAN9US98_9PEZI
MASQRQPILSDSLAKKRARDRRAQQNVRDKRAAHVQALEQRIVMLESELQVLQQRCHSLCCENETLRDRQSQVCHLVTSWPACNNPTSNDVDLKNTAAASTLGTADALLALRRHCPMREDGSAQSAKLLSPALSEPADIRALQTPPTTVAPMPLEGNSLLWNTSPIHVEFNSKSKHWFSACVNSPELALISPDHPQPLELLYGSKTNLLANDIHASTRRWPCRDPERLAAGWLTYYLIKWSWQPCESRFSRLQDFQKPIDDQFCKPHPCFIDIVFWPELRANLIKDYHLYDSDEFVGLLCCCLKVRWPWNEPFLEPRDNGELAMRPDFYNIFTRLDGWGLTREFIDRFPLLFKGVDTSSIHYEII